MAKKTISFLLMVIFLFNNVIFAADIAKMAESSYYISSGDIINIAISPAEEFSREIVVSPDGTIDLPLIGNIKVSGMTPSTLERILTERFSKYISNPKITISIKKFSFYRVGVIGQVQRTGYFEYNEGMKLLDLIAAAGGPGDYADSANIKVYRKTKSKGGVIKEEIFKLSMESFFEGSIEKNIELMPGDIVYVPKQKFTVKTKWVADNILPWTILGSFGISIAIILSR